MRTEEEVGSLKNQSERVNEAYRTYASAYLDFCDDNIKHFMWRDIDIAPWSEADEKGLDTSKEEVLRNAYLDAALNIISKEIEDTGYFDYTPHKVFEEYPLLEQERKDEILKSFEKRGVEVLDDYVLVTDVDYNWSREDIETVFDYAETPKCCCLRPAYLNFNLSKKDVEGLSEDEIIDLCEDQLEHRRVLPEDVLGCGHRLPTQFEVGTDWDEDDITNYICDVSGFFILGYTLSTDPVPEREV